MIFKKKFRPHLINLEDYRYSLLNSLDDGSLLFPAAGILDGDWSCEEREAMKKNRRLAQDIYDEMKKRKG